MCAAETKRASTRKNAGFEKNFERSDRLRPESVLYLYVFPHFISAEGVCGAGIGKAVDRSDLSPYKAFIDGGAASERRMRSLLRL
jgi:hypothetical protein